MHKLQTKSPMRFERKDATGGESVSEVINKVNALGTAWEQFKSVNDARLKEIEKKGSADALHTEHLEKINKAMDDYKGRLDKIETAVSRPAAGAEGEEGKQKADEKEYKKAFLNYLRKGVDNGLADLQVKTMSVGSDPDGGYLVTPQMSSQIITVQNESSPMRQLATVETISTDSLDIMIDRDTTTSGGWTGEQDSRSSTTTPTIGKRNIPAHEMYAQQPITQKLLDDAAINLESWISGKIGERFGLDEATAFISGNGVSRPRGILGYTPADDASFAWGNPGYIASGTSGAVTSDGLVNTLYALKERYAASSSWLMRRATEGAVRVLKDGQGQYMWVPGLAAGKPNTLLGQPVYQASDMEAIGASAYAIALGDWKRAYTIVERIGIRILRDQFTSKPNVLFYATRRVGGDVTNFEAYKLLKLATS
jgi:HK97 family phage major capsid protein